MGNAFVAAGIVLTCLVVPPSAAQIATSTGDTLLVSVTPDGSSGAGESRGIRVAAGGRVVVFLSDADDLVPGHANGFADVFLRDLLLGTTELVSVGLGGLPANGPSGFTFGSNSDVSADGRYVVFASEATNLIEGDGIERDVFRRDRLAGVTERVSVNLSGGEPDAASWDAAVSDDGNVVAFVSHASDLVAGAFNDQNQVYVRDIAAGTTLHVSRSSAGVPANAGCFEPALSGDGRVVAFYSGATSLLPGLDGSFHVFVHVLATAQTELVSVSAADVPGNGFSSWPALSADGRLVAFQSQATNLTPFDANGTASDIYLHDRASGGTQRVSLQSGYTQPLFGQSYRPAISADGRMVAFESTSIDLVTPDLNGWGYDVFVRDRRLALTMLVSPTGGAAQVAESFGASMDATGRVVGLRSFTEGFVPGDDNGLGDVFIHDVGPWTNLQGPLPGAAGAPVLVGSGLLGPAEPVALQLLFAAPVAPALLFLATSSTPAPFKGGVLQAFPPLAALPLATDAQGGLLLATAWPIGVPAGLLFVTQVAVADAGAPAGVALSNALQGLVP
jgi:Tol biopolymer transport system component